VNTCQQRVQDESYRAFLDMLVLNRVRTRYANRVPMLVLGAEYDALVPPRQIRRTAAVYGAEEQIIPGVGHDVMLEPGWQVGAEGIAGWLSAQGL
jgi:pimeloyl-ACP methyl ester carboxylesterase